MFRSHLVFSVLLSAVLVQCQVPQAGKCPSSVSVQSNFQPEKYLGKWYEYAKYPFIFELGAKCITAEYGDLGNGDISVTNTQYGSISGLKSSIKGTAKQVEPAKLNVQFPFAPLNGLSTSNYWVLETDYDNYAVVYSCYDLSILNARVVWILTRERNPSSDFVKRAKDAILRNGLSLDPLIVTDQKNCPA